MKFSKKIFLVIGTFLFLGIFLFVVYPQFLFGYQTSRCSEEETSPLANECWNRLVDRQFEIGGVPQATRAFAKILSDYPQFATDCHRSAHRVGDRAYYDIYFEKESLENIDLPPETAFCGYGFFHGLIEHFIQK